jgi:hypothetical protein
MFRRAGEKYIILQDLIPVEEQWAIERAVIQVLPMVKPSQHFVAQLSEDLLAEAMRQSAGVRQQATRQRNTAQLLKLLGLLGGGLISVIGGMSIWLLVRRSDEEKSLRERGPGRRQKGEATRQQGARSTPLQGSLPRLPQSI